ncbi:hypothetical protein [Roseisolibacter sp. H3M3-2]|uniref:hypothetical protein n=1 Tax=Roseisolibacter sp. H3M3-2 TaxID=3031323 RepID=UPI0023DAD645|nr:hypothetical protein [Roseisolibacter sp. H3M3-2]MDF1504024.1 hypothetical protein [Roseisolibacter sp. H3M3-2]
MKQNRQVIDVEVPVGIVIADGARAEVAPRFAAFVWGPAPEALPAEAAGTAQEPRAA